MAVGFVLPKQFAVHLGGAKHAFDARDADSGPLRKWFRVVLRALGEHAIHDEHAPVGHCRPRVAGYDGRSPSNNRPAVRKFFDDPGFAPDAVPLWAEPLRPI